MAKLEAQKLPLQVLKKFRLIYGSVRQQFRQIEESCGISGSQLWILQEIAKTPGVGVTELAERLSIHQSTCSQLIEKLATRRLILKKRSKEDQRRVGLVPTASALETLTHAPGPAEGILPEALSALSDDALNALDASLTEVISQLRVRDEKFSGKPLSDL
ncbi:Transcriptional regulator, MarR family [Georgfuchsia toluolica]|uniref:Transcriptional regulator, MarR family n=1 Tax=Georgfuchsia toluolica TaxID=424218 RepID=A0A916J5F7_9PROT|nr:helix-turn-helix domain-containing protein [Georgfuchsia toluolica]CAG4885036.1 Transcriptional regulator, MarR family [Georgfuchsia toluolica]